MNEIIPLKKDIIFKTKIGEITNITIEHDYKINDDLVEGSIDISGSYKMTEASVIEEDFYYSIPFSIAISKNIKKDTINIEIEDFKYKIYSDVLSVSIDLNLDCEKEEEIKNEVVDQIDIDLNNYEEENTILDNHNEIIDINDNHDDVVVENSKIEDSFNNITNITNIIDSSNNYYTYKVYIVREGDTLETICTKYNITLEDLKLYNDLTDLHIGDKLLIPYVNE